MGEHFFIIEVVNKIAEYRSQRIKIGKGRLGTQFRTNWQQGEQVVPKGDHP
jgi:hypothetical protein